MEDLGLENDVAYFWWPRCPHCGSANLIGKGSTERIADDPGWTLRRRTCGDCGGKVRVKCEPRDRHNETEQQMYREELSDKLREISGQRQNAA